MQARKSFKVWNAKQNLEQEIASCTSKLESAKEGLATAKAAADTEAKAAAEAAAAEAAEGEEAEAEEEE